MKAQALSRLRSPNPVWRRELQQSSRIGRTPWLVLGLTLSVGIAICLLGGAAASHGSPAETGHMLYQVFFSLAAAVVATVGAGAAAVAMASEREGRTAEALRLTSLTPRKIAQGKLGAALGAISVYLGALIPVGAVPFIFGGITALEVLIGFAFLVMFAALSVSFGLAVGAVLKGSRASIVVTLVLASVLAPTLYLLFGVGGSIALHPVFPELRDGTPIWWPRALIEGTFGVPYVVFLLLTPAVLFAVPTKLFYEIAVTHLGDEAEDRSSRLKRWFLLALFAFTALAVAFQYAARDAKLATTASMLMITGFLFFSVLLFADEPLHPSRRVMAQWTRSAASRVSQFMGPGLWRTQLLVVAVGVPALLVAACACDRALVAQHSRFSAFGILASTLFFATVFFCFVALTIYLRSRFNAWITRVVACFALLTATVVPFMAAGLARASSGHETVAFASPSPAYVLVLVDTLERMGPLSSEEEERLASGLLSAGAYLLVGGCLLASARARLRAAANAAQGAGAGAGAGAGTDTR